MKLFVDMDVVVYRIGYGRNDYDLFENIEPFDELVRTIKNKFPDHQPVYALSNTEPTFRHKLAVTLPYKGNRKQPKPTFYKELREYAVEEWGAIISPAGVEADDYVGMNANRKTDILASIDKDWFMIPAKAHYNFVKDETYKIKRPLYYFWRQMLIGDRADNILGLVGIGEKRADALLDGLKTKEMRKVVEREYQREYGENWKARFEENGHLLWILRDPLKTFKDYV